MLVAEVNVVGAEPLEGDVEVAGHRPEYFIKRLRTRRGFSVGEMNFVATTAFLRNGATARPSGVLFQPAAKPLTVSKQCSTAGARAGSVRSTHPQAGWGRSRD